MSTENRIGKNILLLSPERDKPKWQPGQDVTEWDQNAYERIISTELSTEQQQCVLEPEITFPRQKSVLGIHWHPEFVPMQLVTSRIEKMFPRMENELIIPTQHNVLLKLNGYAGVEVDCYAPEFHRKVQLLLHFREREVAKAHVLKSMLSHTFQYRSSQLFEFIDSILNPKLEDRFNQAVLETGANAEVIEFTKTHAAKLKKLIELNESITPVEMIKNKLIPEYFSAMKEHVGDFIINRSLQLIKCVKEIVKRHFSLEYFYSAHEIIDETRALGGGIIVPHPEQFWPILLADYDVDGYEVWNPQSREYTDFLINVVNKQNRNPARSRTLLIVMGDDTHMSEKVKPVALRDPAKYSREVGVQPPWDDYAIRKNLIIANGCRNKVITEYKARLE